MDLKIRQHKLDWSVESAGTGSWHVGEKPHRGSIDIARKHGISIKHQRARQLQRTDLDRYDLIIAMDSENYIQITKLSDGKGIAKLEMLLNFIYPNENRNVPDPYFEGGFDRVFDMIDHACEAIIEKYK